MTTFFFVLAKFSLFYCVPQLLIQPTLVSVNYEAIHMETDNHFFSYWLQKRAKSVYFLYFFLQKKHFVNYARVAPLRTNLNMKFKASQYRSAVGSLEIVGGFGLLSMTGRTARLIGFVMLIAAELFMIHSYQALGDPLQKYIRLVAAAVLLTAQMMFERWFAGGNGEEEKAPSIPAKNGEEDKAPSMPVKKEKKSRKSKGAVKEESKKESW